MTNSVSVEERFWSIVDPNGVPSDMWEALDILARSYRKDRQSSEREEKLRGVIVQMGENAAEAAKEYAANMEKLREALKDIAGNNWQDQSRARHVARQALEATNG